MSPTHPESQLGLRRASSAFRPGRSSMPTARRTRAWGAKPRRGSCHIGSQILAVEPFAREVEVLIDVARDLLDIGVDPAFIDTEAASGDPLPPGDGPAPTPEDYAGR